MCFALKLLTRRPKHRKSHHDRPFPGCLMSLHPHCGYGTGDELCGKFYGHTNDAPGQFHSVMQWFRETMPGRLLLNHWKVHVPSRQYRMVMSNLTSAGSELLKIVFKTVRTNVTTPRGYFILQDYICRTRHHCPTVLWTREATQTYF